MRLLVFLVLVLATTVVACLAMSWAIPRFGAARRMAMVGVSAYGAALPATDLGTLQRRVRRVALLAADVGVDGTTFVPAGIAVSLSPDDFALMGPVMATSRADLAVDICDRARRRGWRTPARLDLTFEVDSSVPSGAPQSRGIHEEETLGLTLEQRQSTPQHVLRPSSEPRADIVLEPGRSYIAGRSQRCDIVVADPAASRRHVEVRVVPDGLRVRDLDSLNGLSIGGRRVRSAVVVNGGEFRLGRDFAFRYERMAEDDDLRAG